MDGPGAVYYDFSGHHIDGGQNQQLEATPRQCSVRGCTQFITDGLNNKMCDACRGRHRIYATTKRARRKLEKAAVANSALVGGNALALIHESNSAIVVEKDQAVPNMWMGNGQLIMEQESSIAHSQNLSHQTESISFWDQDMDPLLKEGMHIQTIVQPHQRSTESELAHALTYAPHQVRTQAELAGPPPMFAEGTGTGERSDPSKQQSASGIQISQARSSMEEAVNQDQDKSKGTGEPTRYCSVKGCKAVIEASYEFKMCPQCRVRYRTYGTTKRAKWKHERESFQKEMESLRLIEDEKRKAKGLRPLSDNPEELRAWELSVIDEQVPLPAVENLGSLSSLAGAISVAMPSSTQPEVSTSYSSISAADSYSLPVSSIDASSSASPYSHLTMAYSGSPIAPLPARMCTVSHCHKILPAFYRYKRCEQHRLQNRYHSQLKRVREKEVKAAAPDQSIQATVAASEMTEGSSAIGGSGVDQGVVKAMRDRRLKMLRKRKRVQPSKNAKASVSVDDQDVHIEHVKTVQPVGEGGVPIWDLPVGEAQTSLQNEPMNGDAGYSQSGSSSNIQHGSTTFVQVAIQNETAFRNADAKNHANPGTAKKRQYEKLSKFSCASTDCHNLLTPGIRWRMCDDCRAMERQRRSHERQEARDSTSTVSAGNFHIIVNDTSDAHLPQHSLGAIPPEDQITTTVGVPADNLHRVGSDADADSQSDADADAEVDEDGEGEADVGQTIEPLRTPTARVVPEQNHPSQGRPLIWKTNSLDDSTPWASGFSKFRVEKPRLPPGSKNADNQAMSKALNPKASLTVNDDVGSSKQTNPTAGQQSGDFVPENSVSLAASTIPTSESVESLTQTPASPAGPEAISSTARGKRKAASEDTVNSNPAPPPPIPVSSGPYSAPYGYPSSYPYYPYYMPSYPMPPYPYAPGIGGPVGPLKDLFLSSVPPSGGPPAYPPYPYHSSQNHLHPHHHHPHLHPPPSHAPPYGFAPPPPGLPYMPPRYAAPVWGQPSHQVPYSGYPPPPRPGNASPSYIYHSPPFPPPPQISTLNAPAFNHYQPKPDPSPITTATKKRRSKANDELGAQSTSNADVVLPSTQMLSDASPGSSPLTAALAGNDSTVLVNQRPNPVHNLPVDDKDMRQCTNCKRALTPTCHGTICDKCKLRFKKHQIKTKQKFKLEPRKFLREMKPSTAVSQKPNPSEDNAEQL